MRRPLALATVALLAAGGAADAQTRRDTVIVPGPAYAASGWKESLLGDDYRDLWTVPIRVEFLDLGSFGGGLTVIARGGGRQTQSLRLKGGDGRQYAFRSVDKRPDLANVPAFQGTLIDDIIQDQTSSLHPTGALTIPPLVESVGVPHVVPRLVVMPDDPRLGEFREEFAGMLGTIEERPEDQADDGGPFPPFERVIGTTRLLERLEESAEDRVDARTYLVARLMDMILGDWDRHEDQWRWGELQRGGFRLWVPIPRDRDYAYVDYDGLGLDVARRFVRNIVEYTPDIRNMSGLTLNARGLDRRLLNGLERSAWDSAVAVIHRGMNDRVIDAAMERVPVEHRTRNPEIIASLKGRRDDVAGVARAFYDLLNTEVDIRGTDKRDLAIVDRTGDGLVTVRMYDPDSIGHIQGDPYYERTFTDRETREIRIYLQGNDDRLVVRGDVPRSIMVRVVGGGGDDRMVDSSVVRRGAPKAAFYDGRGDNVFVAGVATAVEDEDHTPPEPTTGLSGESYQDWGSRGGVMPVFGYSGIDGPIVGAGYGFTRYGFWREPYAHKLQARAMVGLETGGVAVDVEADVRNTASRGGYNLFLRASQLESMRFYGFGNETVEEETGSFYQFQQSQLLGWASMQIGLPGTGLLSIGPVVKYTEPEVEPGTPFERENVYGEGFGQVGGLLEAEIDVRDSEEYPRRGARFLLDAAGYPAVWHSEGFAKGTLTASTYLTPGFRGAPTLALRAGGEGVWGQYPIHEAAFLGGSRSVRGYNTERFAGDATLFGNAELRVPVATVNLLLLRGVFGVSGLVDTGRVYLGGESSDTWHVGTGGGVWFRFTVKDATVAASATYARGEDHDSFYLRLGPTF